MELTFTREEIPKIVRAGGSGREAEPWETHLSPLKENEGESFRVWTYDKRTSAISRMSSVRERLTTAVPHENWTLAVRVLPEFADKPEDEQVFGVYVAYNGHYTPEQVVENARKRQERSERVKTSRAAAAVSAPAASNGTKEETLPDAPASATAKERVANARAKQGAGK